MVLSPIWNFEVVVARGRFSLPTHLAPRNHHVYPFSYFFSSKLLLLIIQPYVYDTFGVQWAPCHAVVATPLLVTFEFLLSGYLNVVVSVYLQKNVGISG
ncbi:hypothetical protein YC2023_054183 [Brassica napus]